MLKLSFILPCYNVERYVADCLNSIYAQDLPEDEFEVICVNDCSTDKTREVIASIQGQHSNLVLIDQPRNLYSGAARNRGLEVAKGDYIWFVDADDRVKPQVAAHLLDKANGEDLDVLLFNYDEFRDGNESEYNKIKDMFRDTEVVGGGTFAEREFGCNLSRLSLLWLRLVKRSLIEKHGIRFSDLYISQDGPFAWESLLLSQRVMSISERCYDYRANAQSITSNKNTAKKAAVWSFQYPVQIKNVKEKVAGAVPDGVVAWLDQSIRYEVNEFAIRYQRLPAEEKTQYYKAMRAAKGWYKEFKHCLSRKNRMAYWLGQLGEPFFAHASKRLA